MPAPIISVAQMREWEDRTWAAGREVEKVMRLAGAAVARSAMELTRSGDTIILLAGRGNNGGDTRYAAECLTDRDVRLVDVSDPAPTLEEMPEILRPANRHGALLVDGLFGIGLNRELTGEWLEIVRMVNASPAPVLAVDLPSGLNADTGAPMGEAVRADETVTFGAPKAGLVNPAAAPFVGRLRVAAEIGLVSAPEATDLAWSLAEDFNHFPPPRPVAGHKGSFGHLTILAGSRGYHGAAVLAARGALRAMPGLLSVLTTPDAYPLVAGQLQQPMVQPLDAAFVAPDKTSALLIGPGMAGPDVTDRLRSQVAGLWRECPWPIIVDASALDWLPAGSTTGGLRIITPHPGEAARLLDCDTGEIQQDRVGAVRRLSETLGGCLVVLKGNQTLIGAADGGITVNGSGNPGLGQGGSGDVLAGYLAGLIAQPALRETPRHTASHAVWEHGAAADRLSRPPRGWEISELLSVLGNSRV